MLGTSGYPPFPIPTLETETSSWIAQVVTNGGSVDRWQSFEVNRLVKGIKDASLWSSIDDIWLLAACTSVQALTSLKGLRLATNTGSPTFVAKQGFTYNGTSGFTNTGFNPSTMASAFTATSGAIGVYELTNVNSSGRSAGVRGTSSVIEISMINRTSSNAAGQVLNSAVTNTVAISPVTSVGYTVAARTAGPVFTIYKNGVSLGTYSPGSTSTTIPNATLYIGALNNNGTAANFRASTPALVDIRAALSAANEAVIQGLYLKYLKAMGCA